MNHETETADEESPFHEKDDASDASKPVAPVSLMPLPHPQAGAAMLARKRAGRKVTTLMLSSRTCKWPIGDPARSDFHYCGLPPQSGRPYCDTHDQMGYQSLPRRKR